MIKIEIPPASFTIEELKMTSVLGKNITKKIFEEYVESHFGQHKATVINSKSDGTLFILIHNNQLYQFQYFYSSFKTFSRSIVLNYCINFIKESLDYKRRN